MVQSRIVQEGDWQDLQGERRGQKRHQTSSAPLTGPLTAHYPVRKPASSLLFYILNSKSRGCIQSGSQCRRLAPDPPSTCLSTFRSLFGEACGKVSSRYNRFAWGGQVFLFPPSIPVTYETAVATCQSWLRYGKSGTLDSTVRTRGWRPRVCGETWLCAQLGVPRQVTWFLRLSYPFCKSQIIGPILQGRCGGA